MKKNNFTVYNAHPYNLLLNDCVKRSIVITTGMDYRSVEGGLDEHRKITHARTFYSNYNPHSYVENVLGLRRVLISKRSITVGEFARSHKSGRYILAVSGHWTACVNGMIYDTWDCRGEQLLFYYEIGRFSRVKVAKKYCFSVRHKSGEMFVTVFDGNEMSSTKCLSEDDGKNYIDNLSKRGFFNLDEIGEYI